MIDAMLRTKRLAVIVILVATVSGFLFAYQAEPISWREIPIVRWVSDRLFPVSVPDGGSLVIGGVVHQPDGKRRRINGGQIARLSLQQ